MGITGFCRIGVTVFLLVFCSMSAATTATAEKISSGAVKSVNSRYPPAFASSKLQELNRNLKAFDQQVLTTDTEEETLHELIRILNTTTKTYQALNYYVYGWNTTMEYQYRSNLEALKRGIDISRTFIITEQTLHDPEKQQTLLDVMETQKKDGIRISYGLQQELEKEPDYHRFALVDIGLSDDAVLARVTAVSIKGPQPARIEITWNQDRIKELNPFPYLQRSPNIYPYDQEARKKLLEIFKKHGSP